MASITPVPINLTDITLTLAIGNTAANNYEASVSGATFTPSVSTSTWRGMTPSSVYSFSTSPTWTLDLDYAQDWTTAESLSSYLIDNLGQTATATLTTNTGADTWTAQVILNPGAIGGKGQAVAESSVSLPVQGNPSRAE